MIIVSYTCPKCGQHVLAAYDIDIKAKKIFLPCEKCGALLEIGQTKTNKKD